MHTCWGEAGSISKVPPYPPDINPIEEFFAELQAFVKKHWKIVEDTSVLELNPFSSGVSTRWEEERQAHRVISGSRD